VTRLTVPELAGYAARAGFAGESLVWAVALSLRESGGDPTAIGDVDNPCRGCKSYGLLQINVCPRNPACKGNPGNNAGVWFRENPALLLEPLNAFRAAFEMSAGGSNWGPWSTYRSGIIPPEVERVRTDLARSGVGTGIVGGGLDLAGSPVSTGTVEATPAVFENNPLSAAVDLFGLLSNPQTWLRVLGAGLGLTLATVGIVLIARDKATAALRSVVGGSPASGSTPAGSTSTGTPAEVPVPIPEVPL
jgi:hypothetical protein